MKRTFILEEVLKTEHKITVEVADDLGIADEVFDADEQAFDEALSVIKISSNLDDCKSYISTVYGINDFTIESGVFETETFGFVREE